MRTENVSYKPQFTGTVKYIKNTQELLEPKLGQLADELKALIADRPYDLYIERSQNMKGFYEINANVSYENVMNGDFAKKGRPSVVYGERLERIISAANEAMKSFERAPEYKKLIKGDGIFKELWQAIIGKFKKQG